MTNKTGRPGFREWIDRQDEPDWRPMPLTHVTKALVAEDIIREDRITPRECSSLGDTLAYFFYGRPAYRANNDAVVKMEAACPYCFLFSEDVVRRAKKIFAFDSGAYQARMYKHVLLDEMELEDFSLETDSSRPNKLIRIAFGSQENYFDGNRAELADPLEVAEAWEYSARAYLELLASPGRNEPDDRICSIEVAFGDPVLLKGSLIAVVVPHTHWRDDGKSPWLHQLEVRGVEIVPYTFIPGRHPEFYQTQMEEAVRQFYRRRGTL
jgi:hypothetical protein